MGGGEGNSAGYAGTVAGGKGNSASGTLASVSGGWGNFAGGYAATAAGGLGNSASGGYGFAAGYRAKATHLGSFVWADVNNFDFGSNANDSFSARATGGARFVSAINGTGAATAGVSLAAGGGSWSALSDRAAKRDFASVNEQALLGRLARIPVKTWRYRTQKASIRHIGPTAQDFARAFHVGEDRRHITTVDADGVALAAIQALYRENQALKRNSAEKAATISALRRQNRTQNARLAALERATARLARRGR